MTFGFVFVSNSLTTSSVAVASLIHIFKFNEITFTMKKIGE